jgi:hypothetical protein
MVQLLDRLRRVHSTRVEGGLNRLDPLLDGGSALYDAIVVRHLTLRGDSSILRASCEFARRSLRGQYFAIG